MRAPRRRVGLFVLAWAALLLHPMTSFAEVKSSVTVSSYTSLLYSGNQEEPVAAAAILKGSLNLDSVGNKNVKGYFQLDSWIGNSLGFDVPRAYLKVRFPWFRLTLGKTRLSWGDGFLFNAGDVLFGSMGVISGDLSGETLREETGWLTALNLPVGSFSFLEAVLVPYGLPAATGSLETDLSFLADTVDFDELSAGARGVFKLGRTTLETGYYYASAAAAADREHRPYLSLHGHLLVDWNLSAAMAIPAADPQWQQWEQWLSISAGIFHLFNLGSSRTLSFRLEAGIQPGADWTAVDLGEDYGIYFFPEVAYSPTDTLSLQLRSLVSPVDLSALSMASVSWNVYQGLNVFSYLTLMSGEWKKDLYSLDKPGSASWTVGLEFVY